MRSKKKALATSLALLLVLIPSARTSAIATDEVSIAQQDDITAVKPVAAFIVSNTSDSGPGSLRQAMLDANSQPGADVISFQIESGMQTITPLSQLPAITDSLIIDATTQPGFSVAPLIVLNGSQAGTSASGFIIEASNCAIAGFVINGFDDVGVRITGASATGNTVRGCYIGTNADGTAAQPNKFHGVEISSGARNNTIGGTDAGARNVISGNAQSGVGIYFPDTNNNVVAGNYIGTDRSGTQAVPNDFGVVIQEGPQNNLIGGLTPSARNTISANAKDGVFINGVGANNNTVQGNFIGTNASGAHALANRLEGVEIAFGAQGNLIGGTAAGAGNVISGNMFFGVGIFNPGTDDNTVQGNYIGVQSDGMSPLGNGLHGVFNGLTANNNLIGGTASGAGNIIAFNNGAGVSIDSGNGIAVHRNSIYSNAGLGIDLSPVGLTQNDPNDIDQGANSLQNFPALTAAANGSSTTIQGTFNGARNASFTIEFFSSAASDDSGFGEGRQFIGSTMVTTDSNGNATINATMSATVPGGQFISATATDSSGNTSEFSQCIQVAGSDQPDAMMSVNGPAVVNGCAQTITYTLTASNSGTATIFRAVVTDDLAACLSDIQCSTTQGECAVSGSKATINLDRLDPGASATITLTARLNQSCEPSLSNTASINADLDANPANNSSTLATGVNCGPKLDSAIKEGKKRLIVTGRGFDNGAKILVNDQAQKTKNDAANPTTRLIGSKAGKKVKPGDRIRVRNSDGTESNEIIFSPPN
ncbi:MAG: hypothetical protein AB1631_05625 [Acidobacteriota bacterium]